MAPDRPGRAPPNVSSPSQTHCHKDFGMLKRFKNYAYTAGQVNSSGSEDESSEDEEVPTGLFLLRILQEICQTSIGLQVKIVTTRTEVSKETV